MRNLTLLVLLLLAALTAMIGPRVADAGVIDACSQPHSKNGLGRFYCMANFPSWSYDQAAGQCVKFVYGGCFGNDNRFETEAQCLAQCKTTAVRGS